MGPLRVVALVGAGVLVFACTNDFTIGVDTAPNTPIGPRPPDAGPGMTSAADASTTPPPAPAEKAATQDAGTGMADAAPNGKKGHGEPCDQEGADPSCLGGVCEEEEGRGSKTFCTLPCDNEDDEDPICAGTKLTGRCSKDGFCVVK